MVKGKTGRTRYILFKVTKGRATRYQLLDRFREFSRGEKPWLTIYTGRFGILKCRHTHMEEMIKALNAIQWAGTENNPLHIKTVAVSGTIKKVKRYLQ